jgi:hypothetical protein
VDVVGSEGVTNLRDWDSREGERFVTKFQPAIAEFSTAIVLLALLDPEIRKAALPVGDDVTQYAKAGKDSRAQAQSKVRADLTILSTAVQLYLRKRWWRRGPFRPSSK